MKFAVYTSKVSLLLTLVLLLLASRPGFAQNRFGIMPQINFNFKIGKAWKVNSKFENRFILYQNPYKGTGNRSEYERTDLEIVVARNKGPLKNLGAGYLVRRSHKDGSFLHRSLQQYSLGQQIGSLQLAHRFRLDQTFEKNEPTQYRVRYRLSLEKPLNGLKVDPEEFYLKFSNEYLGILKDGKSNMEIRALASMGYNHSKDNKLEVGLDYRVEKLIGEETENLLWLTLGWYHSF